MPQDDEVELLLDEACYYLRKKGLSFRDISKKMQRSSSEVRRRYVRYLGKVERREVEVSDFDRSYWENVEQESEGNVKVTFVKRDGFYHCRRSDLEKMDEAALVEIFDSCKLFLEMDPSYHFGFLDVKPPVGYDPLALSREIKKTVGIVEKMLVERGGGKR